jgi:hypothetical protein
MLIAQQMESSVVFGLSAALFGEITIDKGRVQQSNFNNYPVLRMPHRPMLRLPQRPLLRPHKHPTLCLLQRQLLSLPQRPMLRLQLRCV